MINSLQITEYVSRPALFDTVSMYGLAGFYQGEAYMLLLHDCS